MRNRKGCVYFRVQCKRPGEAATSRTTANLLRRLTTVTIAQDAHPSTEDHDDTVEAHYSGLERPCACVDDWVFITYEDEYGEEREVSYRCRRCADSR